MKTNNTPLEAAEARTAMQYMQARHIRFTHIKNETGRPDSSGKIRNWKAIYDKQDGVSPGFPDFAIVLPGIGLLIPELKRLEGGVVSQAQQEWIDALNTVPGVEARVCKGAIGIIEFIEEFYPLSTPLPRLKSPVTDKNNLNQVF